MPPLRLALYQPDIPQNTGNMLRTAACLGIGVDVIGPAGFVWDERRLRRAGMDYLDRADVAHHTSWAAYLAARADGAAPAGRLVLLTTRASAPYTSFRFAPGDTLTVGRESAGVPDAVHDAADARIRVPMTTGLRSLNVAAAAAMVLGEALRQLGAFPGDAPPDAGTTEGPPA